MTKAFSTEEGAKDWTPSVVKELTKIGPKYAFAMEQVDYRSIPSGAPIMMLQAEHSRKKETDERKTRLVVNGAQEPFKEGEDNYAPTGLAKGGQLLFALATQECRSMRGIDITCAFASESLTAEDGDIYVKYPDVLAKHFGWLLDQQREEQQDILAAEESAKMKAELVTAGSFAELDDDKRNQAGCGTNKSDSFDDAIDTTHGQESGRASKGSRSKRRREAKDACEQSYQTKHIGRGNKSKKWKERRAEKARLRGVSDRSRQPGYYSKCWRVMRSSPVIEAWTTIDD
jgi:hypothetical protein